MKLATRGASRISSTVTTRTRGSRYVRDSRTVPSEGEQGAVGLRATAIGDAFDMNSKKKELSDRLREAAATDEPLRIDRDQEWWADPIYGFVVGLNGRWVAIQALADSLYVDGYEFIRLDHITDVAGNDENRFVTRGLARLGRPEVDFELPEASSTTAVVRAVANYAPLACVHMESDWDRPFIVGRIEAVDHENFDIQLISPSGMWVPGISRWPLSDVTRMSVGDRYSSALEEFGDQRPTPGALDDRPGSP